MASSKEERQLIQALQKAEARSAEAQSEMQRARVMLVRYLLRDRTMEEVGSLLGISRQRVSQLANKRI